MNTALCDLSTHILTLVSLKIVSKLINQVEKLIKSSCVCVLMVARIRCLLSEGPVLMCGRLSLSQPNAAVD